MDDHPSHNNSTIVIVESGLELRPYDIICGRCSTAFNNIGNRRFRVTISLNLKRYMGAPNRRERSIVIQRVVDVLLKEAGARFLKRKGVDFLVLDTRQVRQKVQHALRDMAAFKLFEDEEDEGNKNNPGNLNKYEVDEKERIKKDGWNYVDEDEDDCSLMEVAPFMEDEHMLISAIGASPGLKSKPEPIGEFHRMPIRVEDREDLDYFLNKGESFDFFNGPDNISTATINDSSSVRL